MFHFKLRGSKPAALFLSAALLLSSIHWTPPAAAANEWMQDSLDKLTNWGVVLGDEAGGLNLDARLPAQSLPPWSTAPMVLHTKDINTI